MTKILLLTLSLLVVACSPKSEDNKTEDLSYQYSVNGCDTGVIKYTSAADLCAKLKDDATNKNCASSLRYEQFKTNCPGQKWN